MVEFKMDPEDLERIGMIDIDPAHEANEKYEVCHDCMIGKSSPESKIDKWLNSFK